MITTLTNNLKGDVLRIDTNTLKGLIKTIDGFGSTSTVDSINSITDNKILLTNELIKALNVINQLKEA